MLFVLLILIPRPRESLLVGGEGFRPGTVESLKLGLFPTGGTRSSSCTLGPGDLGGGGYFVGHAAGDASRAAYCGAGERGGLGVRGTMSPSVESRRLGDLNLDKALSKDKNPRMERPRETRDGVFCNEAAVGEMGSAYIDFRLKPAKR